MVGLSAPVRILAIAPLGRDAELLCSVLKRPGLECIPILSIAECAQHLSRGADTVFITEEVVRNTAAFRELTTELAKEPEWSDLPVIALVDPRAVRELIQKYEAELEKINLTFIERPVRSDVLSRALSSALRARARQYQVRDFLAEKLRSQENLWRTQKLESIGVLAGGIAHDFNNLLTGILGNASILSAQLSNDKDLFPLVERVNHAAERAADLTRQLLAYSGRGKFITEPLDLSVLIDETVELIRASVPARVELRFDLDKSLPMIIGDRTQLEQVVMNLVINASESVPDGVPGWVRIATCTEEISEATSEGNGDSLPVGKYVRLSVEDSGSGMSEETMSRLFEPFFTTKFTGRGLGLSAVEGIVRGHSGRISVNSQLGVGTRFTVLLPASNVAHVNVIAPAKHKVHSGSGHILVVDDERIVRDVAKSILGRLGYRVSLAVNGQEALDVLSSSLGSGIDLIVLDWTMPVMDGAGVMARLQVEYPEKLVLISTGFSESYAREVFAGRQIAGFVQKPFSLQKLGEAVSQCLKKRAPRAESPVRTSGGDTR